MGGGFIMTDVLGVRNLDFAVKSRFDTPEFNPHKTTTEVCSLNGMFRHEHGHLTLCHKAHLHQYSHDFFRGVNIIFVKINKKIMTAKL